MITLLNRYLIHFEFEMFSVVISSYMTYQKFSLLEKRWDSWILYPILVYLMLKHYAIFKSLSTWNERSSFPVLCKELGYGSHFSRRNGGGVSGSCDQTQSCLHCSAAGISAAAVSGTWARWETELFTIDL